MFTSHSAAQRLETGIDRQRNDMKDIEQELIATALPYCLAPHFYR
jgi:hypothetical protein